MTDTPDTFTVPIGEVQPSQLLVSSAKLAAVVERFDFDDPDYGVLPVREIAGERVLTDGHTRAVRAALAGNDELRVYETPTTCRWRCTPSVPGGARKTTSPGSPT